MLTLSSIEHLAINKSHLIVSLVNSENRLHFIVFRGMLTTVCKRRKLDFKNRLYKLYGQQEKKFPVSTFLHFRLGKTSSANSGFPTSSMTCDGEI